MSAVDDLSWEFRPFVFDEWRSGQKWSFLATADRFQDYKASLVAREYLWEQVEPTVMERLEPLLADGWQPVETIGPEVFDLKKTEQTEAHFGLEDVLLGALTLTLLPIFYGVIRPVPKRYVCYAPCAFTVMLRRPITLPEALPAA